MSNGTKKPLIGTNFAKGFAAGLLVSAVFNKATMLSAVAGLVAGVTMEQSDPTTWPNIADKTKETWTEIKQLYQDR